MTLPHYKPVFIRGLSENHVGLDTIPASTGHWQGMTREQKDAQNEKRLKFDIQSMLHGACVFAGVMAGAGNTVIVDSYDGNNYFRFAYAHLNELFVKENEYIAEGQALGKMGFSGVDVDNIHLHLTVVKNPEFLDNPIKVFQDSGIIDPMLFFSKKWNAKEGAYILEIREGINEF